MPLSYEDFESWELRLRGYEVFSHAIEPALPFCPLPRRTRMPPNVDDGRRAGLLDLLFGARPRLVEEVQEPVEPCVPEARERDIAEFLMRAPGGFEVREDLGGALLEALSASRYPISFELLGSTSGVEVQWAVSPLDADLLTESLEAFYPEVRVDERVDHLADAFNAPADEVFVTHLDFGLAGHAFCEFECARSLALDPFIGVATALENAREEDEGACLQVVFEPADVLWGQECLDALEALEAPADMLACARRKFSQKLYAVNVGLSAWSPSSARTDRIAKSVGNALIAALRGEHNALIALSNADYPIRDHTEGMLRRTARRAGMLLSASELFTLVHVPASSVRAFSLARLQEARTKTAPVGVLGRGIMIGVNEHDGESRDVALSIEQRLRHTYLIGASGTGKSTLMLSMIVQDIEQGRGIALLDPHGDLVDDVLSRIPDARQGDVVLVDPADEDYPVGLNVLGASSNLERTLLSSDLVAIFRRLSTSWGDQMNAVLANAVIAILESPAGGTLLDLRRFLVDPGFRSEFLKTVQDPETVFYWRREFPLLSGRPQASILTRLDAFLRTKPVRFMVAQKDRSLDFRRILDHRQILLCRLSQGAIGEENSYLLGSLIVSKLQQAALSRQDEVVSRRSPFFLYLDEFHHFVTPSLASLLSGVRKYGVGLTLAHQDLQQVAGRDSDVAAAALSNPATRVVFRVGDSDARKLEGGFSFFEARDLQSLGTGEAIARVERADFDFNLRTSPLPEIARQESDRRRSLIRARSRAAHATPRAVVEELLERQHREVADDAPRVATRAKGRAARPAPQRSDAEHQASENSGAAPSSTAGTQSPTSPVSASRVNDEGTLPGRGGPEHKYVQSYIRKLAEERGFDVTVEQRVLGGRGHVDVALEHHGTRIGCEISVTTSPSHEAENLAKCLAAGFDYAVLVSSEPRTLARVQKQLALRPTDRRVRYLTPTALIAFLDEVVVEAQDRGGVRKNHPDSTSDPTVLGAAEAAAYLGLARQTLAKFRVTGESPPYFKVGSRVVYNRLDLDAWLSARRRKSTADRGANR